ncbi:hypothetical protein, conserved [Eimeria maxima]|uniref:Uncharacterized protein n=1 Tax=Eimeria maxima TaxID=5804 RepID=U6M3Q8_EIMMA|nr:hypothetical protein, conserved [Eimeria maxima]CDJ56335.1 hypothetical protein, conserved [Eimeria maxima]
MEGEDAGGSNELSIAAKGLLGRKEREERIQGWIRVLLEGLGALEAALAIGDDREQTDSAAAAAAAAAADPAAAAVLKELREERNKLTTQTQIEEGLSVLLLGPPNAGMKRSIEAARESDVLLLLLAASPQQQQQQKEQQQEAQLQHLQQQLQQLGEALKDIIKEGEEKKKKPHIFILVNKTDLLSNQSSSSSSSSKGSSNSSSSSASLCVGSDPRTGASSQQQQQPQQDAESSAAAAAAAAAAGDLLHRLDNSIDNLLPISVLPFISSFRVYEGLHQRILPISCVNKLNLQQLLLSIQSISSSSSSNSSSSSSGGGEALFCLQSERILLQQLEETLEHFLGIEEALEEKVEDLHFALHLLSKLRGIKWKTREAVEIIQKNFCLGK